MLERAAACIYITSFSSLPSFQAMVITDLLAMYCVERSEFYKGKKYDKVDNDYDKSGTALYRRVYDGIKWVFKKIKKFCLRCGEPKQRAEYEMIDFSENSPSYSTISLHTAEGVRV